MCVYGLCACREDRPLKTKQAGLPPKEKNTTDHGSLPGYTSPDANCELTCAMHRRAKKKRGKAAITSEHRKTDSKSEI